MLAAFNFDLICYVTPDRRWIALDICRWVTQSTQSTHDQRFTNVRMCEKSSSKSRLWTNGCVELRKDQQTKKKKPLRHTDNYWKRDTHDLLKFLLLSCFVRANKYTPCTPMFLIAQFCIVWWRFERAWNHLMITTHSYHSRIGCWLQSVWGTLLYLLVLG